MSSHRDEGPVYYREIQKNAYLTRLPNDMSSGKLRPLGNKKVQNKPMWTQFCVHNGRTPYLEQYPEPDSPATLTHKPVWRACLRSARHITGSVKPHCGDQYDFLIDTDNGAVRMLAPDWEAMQDWVTTLRNTLHELKIVGRGENVYCAGPAPAPPAPPRAAARDPTSPLPPTPPTPPDRVPGIELNRTIRPQTETTTQPEPIHEPEIRTDVTPETEGSIEISNWDTPVLSMPSTSQARTEPKKSLAKICGQNICLDDSIFKRTSDGMDSDDEFFAEIDKASESNNIDFDGYKQRLVINDEKACSSAENSISNNQGTNITVIQVSNKEAPHTAIPVIGPETDVFDFDFKQNLTITDSDTLSFVNIVNTEQNDYDTTFSNDDYGHLNMTTTVSLSGPNSPYPNIVTTKKFPTNNEELYEKLCMASTSNTKISSLAVKNVKHIDKNRKSSLPNLDVNDSNYEYLFLSNNNSTNVATTVSNSANTASNSATSASNIVTTTNNLPVSTSSVSHTTSVNSNLSCSAANFTTPNVVTTPNNLTMNSSNTSHEVNSNGESHRVQISSTSINPMERIRSLERSRSQNDYDASPGARERENFVRRVQNNSPKREQKNDKMEQPQSRPIWKRGLTELSLLTRLRAKGQSKKHESPTRNDHENNFRSQVLNVKVLHRSRAEVRDSMRRRSSSLSNGVPPIPSIPQLQSLRARQAAELRAEQRRGAALVAELTARHPPPIFADYNKQIWVSAWGGGCARWGGHCGDRVVAVRGTQPRDAAHAASLLHNARGPIVDILFHRVPLGNIYVINKREQESLGIKLDNECNITHVETLSGAGRLGLPPPGRWALTEVNNRPLNLIKGGEDDMNRLSMHGSEVSILIQPSPLVKKLRAALKANKTLLGLR